jgi:hypothetical protein
VVAGDVTLFVDDVLRRLIAAVESIPFRWFGAEAGFSFLGATRHLEC